DSYLDLKESIFTKLMNIPGGEGVVKTIRKTKSTLKSMVIPGMFFEDMGITYLGPVDGHNIKAIREVLADAKRKKGPVLVHVITEKGKGYGPAERHPARFHGTDPFVIETGIPSNPHNKASYTNVFSTVMIKLGERNRNVCAITAAMADGTGLKRFRNAYPERFFDVGIAEEHAVTFAAGLAAGGLRPIVCIYSSFLQRAYDQIVHDVCIQNLPVVFAIDRAGIVGSDGETHQGIFDLSFLSSIPNMTVMAPKNKWELSDMMKFAVTFDGPIAVRYPKGVAYEGLEEFRAPIEYAGSETIFSESEIALVAVGSMVKTAEAVRDTLKNEGHDVTLVNARFVKPIDEDMLYNLTETHRMIVTLEENVSSGGFGERVREYLSRVGYKGDIITVAIPDEFVEHGNVDILKKAVGIDEESVLLKIREKL
ncbi:MAG: 1-deoxy-D-xylulose-5-phosphate synthase, partial [Lachnospiraceae bacterium]|nr:1-deoxy-D-xylulose-5-phosphate synthase [Lachnospiraceae bacterium]